MSIICLAKPPCSIFCPRIGLGLAISVSATAIGSCVADECADPSELWQAAWLGGANGPVRGPMKFVNQLATTGWNSVLAYYQRKQQLQQKQQLQKNRQQQQQSQQQQNQIYQLLI